jgi:hypothetical protein
MRSSIICTFHHDQIKEDEMRGACSMNWGGEKCTQSLVGKPERKRPLKRPGHRWEDNIKMDLMEIGFEGVDWINLAQYRDLWQAHVNMVMSLPGP